MREKFWMFLAMQIDRWNPGYCWASLAMWAMGRAKWEDVASNENSCTESMERTGTCWCGKLCRQDIREKIARELQS